MTEARPAKRRRCLTLWAPAKQFEVRGAQVQRAPSPEERARDDEQVKRLEAAIVRKDLLWAK